LSGAATSIGEHPGRRSAFWSAAAALALSFMALAGWFARAAPAAVDRDAAGRLEEYALWRAGGPPPAATRGPLYFYLLRAGQAAGVPLERLRWVDQLSAGIFLLFFLLFARRVFGPWIALGAGAALVVHPFALRLAAGTTAFFPFLAFLFGGFWAAAPAFSETGGDRRRLAIGGAALAAAAFIRFEGIFFAGGLLLLMALTRRRREALAALFGMSATAALIFIGAYASPRSFLFGSGFFVTSAPIATPPDGWLFLRFVSRAFGVFPFAAALAAAGWSLRDRRRRPWALLFLLYFAATLALYLRGGFQYDLIRYDLFLLPCVLLFFGEAARRLLPAEHPRLTAATLATLYGLCAGFYAFNAWQEVILRR
jgi:hypothetical protein